MWNPGFPFLESHPALVRGYHRSFCVESTHYRGTKEKPGLVLGLDRGGACRGRAYKVCRTQGKTVTDYLHEREMLSGIYEPRWLKATLHPSRRFADGGAADADLAATAAAGRHGRGVRRRSPPQNPIGDCRPIRSPEQILRGVGTNGTERRLSREHGAAPG